MATFKIEQHTVYGGGAAVCVFDDEQRFVATVCWRDGSIIVISKYTDTVHVDEVMPPCTVIKLKERR
jgi:ketosteroid isomerase-like protein